MFATLVELRNNLVAGCSNLADVPEPPRTRAATLRERAQHLRAAAQQAEAWAQRAHEQEGIEKQEAAAELGMRDKRALPDVPDRSLMKIPTEEKPEKSRLRRENEGVTPVPGVITIFFFSLVNLLSGANWFGESREVGTCAPAGFLASP
eukprot:5312498-Prymnesium_polylepis.1